MLMETSHLKIANALNLIFNQNGKRASPTGIYSMYPAKKQKLMMMADNRKNPLSAYNRASLFHGFADNFSMTFMTAASLEPSTFSSTRTLFSLHNQGRVQEKKIEERLAAERAIQIAREEAAELAERQERKARAEQAKKEALAQKLREKEERRKIRAEQKRLAENEMMAAEEQRVYDAEKYRIVMEAQAKREEKLRIKREAAAKKAEEERARKAAEAARKKKAAEESRRKKAQAEQARKAAEAARRQEAERVRKEEEAQAAREAEELRLKREEESRVRKAAKEARQKKLEEEAAMRKAAKEARMKEVEEQERQKEAKKLRQAKEAAKAAREQAKVKRQQAQEQKIAEEAAAKAAKAAKAKAAKAAKAKALKPKPAGSPKKRGRKPKLTAPEVGSAAAAAVAAPTPTTAAAAAAAAAGRSTVSSGDHIMFKFTSDDCWQVGVVRHACAKSRAKPAKKQKVSGAKKGRKTARLSPASPSSAAGNFWFNVFFAHSQSVLVLHLTPEGKGVDWLFVREVSPVEWRRGLKAGDALEMLDAETRSQWVAGTVARVDHAAGVLVMREDGAGAGTVGAGKAVTSRVLEGCDFAPPSTFIAAAYVEDDHHSLCTKCGVGGDVLLCDYPGCPAVWHTSCAELAVVPDGDWFCPNHD